MPTYQYRCKECDHELEVVQSFSDDPLESCPECQGRLKKVYGNVGISFKGSGFYKTDSRRSSKPSTGSTGDGAGKDGTKGDAPTEKKPEKKPDTSTGTSTGSGSGSNTT